MNKWQPIETAPKDGVCIMLVDAFDMYIGFRSKTNENWAIKGILMSRITNPTNWMPLPEMP